METDSLRLFVLAADTLNISAAGRTLGLAPAVASARLAKLENHLGADLLHRTTRKVSLSVEGQDFLPYAREILAQEDAALAALGHKTEGVTGTLRFAAPSSFAQLYIAPMLPAFQAAHPGITLDLRFSDARFDLIEGSFDLALRNLAIADTSLKGRKLAQDRRILCAAPSYLAEHGTPQTPDDLAKHTLIAFQDLTPRTLVHRDGTQASFDPKQAHSRLIIDDGNSQMQATIAGGGISANSYWLVSDEIAKKRLVQVLPDFSQDTEAALWLVYPKANVLTAKVRVFIDFLLSEVAPTVPTLTG